MNVRPAASATQEFDRLRAELGAQASLDAASFAAQTKVPFSVLGAYDPSAAAGMDLVQKSAVALNASELGALTSQGFVVSQRQAFPSFFYGYQTIYAQDLPLYVSADSILFAVHESYDAILAQLEQAALSPDLSALLTGMSGLLSNAALPAPLRASTDVYLTTARSLLAGAVQAPVDAKNAAEVSALFQLATAAAGPDDVTVFGLQRTVDFSQFQPRGHYLGNPVLEHYFRAVMWLGRIDLRIIAVQPDGSQVFERGQLEAAVALRGLMDPSGRAKWTEIDDAITAFVGEHDDMTPAQVDGLLNDVGAAGVAALGALSDATLAQAVIDGGYGAQRIASQIVLNGLNETTLPLSRSFAFLGQRYVLDSNVFSNVVYDRVLSDPERMMPNPLDVAYAALGNNQAGMLLDSELTTYAYAPALQGMRILADEHGSDFWQGNLYNLWLGALRALSPSAAVAKPADAGLPSVFGTDSWGR
ncbi:MAG TPA: DUF3160 domain-containing protein, partial [Polyangiaceae bacterium]|nr:DUF3160 domain-containing protein [Polyangiaceae bacterium]